MALGILQISGVDYDPATLYPDPISDPYLIADTLPGTYRDITSIENLNLYIFDVSQDYKFVRDEIKQIIEDLGGGNVDTGFGTLTDAEKNIACEMIIGSHAVRLAYLGSHSVMKALCYTYDLTVTPVRQIRINHARQELHTRIPSNALEAESEAGALIDSYLRFGIEGTTEGDPEGFIDWLFGRAGTTYDAAGLLQKPWATDPAGYGLTAVCNKMYDIIHKGLY
jgi:hypothetical protein